MSRISLSLVPPGGWVFAQDGFNFEGQTFNDLVGIVEHHRASNGKPAGDPKQEIQDQICQRNPSTCLGVPMNYASTTAPHPFVDSLRNFATAAKNFLMHGGAMLDQNTANIRASTCSKCHNNVPAEQSRQDPLKCGVCGGAVNHAVEITRNIALAGRKTPSDGVLKTCALCGCDLRIKVWLPVKYFDPKCENANKYPSFCWMKDCK